MNLSVVKGPFNTAGTELSPVNPNAVKHVDPVNAIKIF